ncbi:hypothetical protein VNO80_21569 [Phaseolus coccineus]|uniref:Apyrase 7 n=1 Tax=Phaseolus coccineus TaxID=3886 RepID=A0AAN9QXU6_PHACN
MEVPKSPSKYKRIAKHKWLIKFGLVILVMLLLFLGFYLESKTGKLNASSYYTVVVDCGSSGTRLNVYEWMVGVKGINKGNLPVLLHSYPDNTTRMSSLWKSSCQYHCMQTEPGLHNFVNDSLGVRQALEPLIVWAEQVVPQEMRGDTPAFVLGTAGLRGLPREDADRVLGDIEAVMKDHSFMMSKSWIRVLSGKEEAYYGWVALNYKMGTFDDSYPKSPTLGLVDIGGSSLQIVVEIDGAGDDVHVMRSRLRSMEHRIMAYSLPAFGLNDAFDRTVLMLRNNQSEEKTASISELRHPCLVSTYVQNYTCHSCPALASIYKKNDRQHQESELYSLRLTGEPDWEQCKKLAIAAAMNPSDSRVSHLTVSKNCQASPFSGIGTDIVNLTAVAHPIKFHALSGFFFVYNKLNLTPRTNVTMVWESGKQICSNLWSGLGSVSDNPNYAGQFCFQVAYMASLIDYGLCLGDVEMVFGPGNISWTLGAALIEGKFLWLNSTSHKAHVIISTLKNVKVTSSPTVLFAILVLLLLIVYCSQIKLPMPSRRVSTPGSFLPSYTHVRLRSN